MPGHRARDDVRRLAEVIFTRRLTHADSSLPERDLEKVLERESLFALSAAESLVAMSTEWRQVMEEDPECGS